MGKLKIGIGRISYKDQNDARQREAFREIGIEDRYMFIDVCSGNAGNIAKREEYNKAKLIVRAGDEVYLDALDRLGRNTEEIEQEWRYFTEEVGCYIIVLNMPLLDTRPRDGLTDMHVLISKIVRDVLAWMAQKETEERKRRQRGGIEAAKKAGKYKGRKPIPVGDAFFAIAKQWQEGKISLSEAQRRLEMSPSTFFRRCKEHGIRKEREQSK